MLAGRLAGWLNGVVFCIVATSSGVEYPNRPPLKNGRVVGGAVIANAPVPGIVAPAQNTLGHLYGGRQRRDIYNWSKKGGTKLRFGIKTSFLTLPIVQCTKTFYYEKGPDLHEVIKFTFRMHS